ncbi:MAG TPA: hypothetical protein VIQ27_18305 [Gemmatimonadales bacterium]
MSERSATASAASVSGSCSSAEPARHPDLLQTTGGAPAAGGPQQGEIPNRTAEGGPQEIPGGVLALAVGDRQREPVSLPLERDGAALEGQQRDRPSGAQ